MRKFGLIVLCGGALAFFYASAELSKTDPVPDGLSISDSLDYPAGRWELARYGAAGAAVIGVLLLLFPEGR